VVTRFIEVPADRFTNPNALGYLWQLNVGHWANTKVLWRELSSICFGGPLLS
jgi:hypothetical protein